MKPFLKPKASSDKTISQKELKEQISDQLGNRLSSKWCLHTADTHFFLPNFSDAKTLIQNNSMVTLASKEGAEKRGEAFDCDDFSLILKARFAYDNYKNLNNPNRPYCYGIVWGMLPFPFPHSMNWMLTDQKKFYFIEPQRERIISLEKTTNYRYITFMMV
jgi:hypothetical protein